MMASSVEQARALDAADGKIDGYYHGNKVCAPPTPCALDTRVCGAAPPSPPSPSPGPKGNGRGGHGGRAQRERFQVMQNER